MEIRSQVKDIRLQDVIRQIDSAHNSEQVHLQLLANASECTTFCQCRHRTRLRVVHLHRVYVVVTMGPRLLMRSRLTEVRPLQALEKALLNPHFDAFCTKVSICRR